MVVHWESIVLALVVVVAGALYIWKRWGRSPQAYRVMVAVAACYFVAGTLVGVSLMRPAVREGGPVAGSRDVGPVAAAVQAPALAPTLKNVDLPPSESAPLPVMHYDPASAVRPDPKLTPGDVFADASTEDVCTLGRARAHRSVSEAERESVYAEYPDSTWTCVESGSGCEVDHLSVGAP
jgi:hypothetical protein